MGTHNEYLIPFKGLENGIHYYRFQVSTDFFSKFENSRIQKGNYTVDLIFDKRDQMMILDLSFDGNYSGACDRCLVMIDIPHEGQDQIIIKLQGDSNAIESDEVVIIDDDSHEIDVSGFIHEMIHLHLLLINERDCDLENYKFCDHSILDKIDGEQKKEGGSGDWDILKDLNLD